MGMRPREVEIPEDVILKPAPRPKRPATTTAKAPVIPVAVEVVEDQTPPKSKGKSKGKTTFVDAEVPAEEPKADGGPTGGVAGLTETEVEALGRGRCSRSPTRTSGASAA
jgi:hypothetical protein